MEKYREKKDAKDIYKSGVETEKYRYKEEILPKAGRIPREELERVDTKVIIQEKIKPDPTAERRIMKMQMVSTIEPLKFVGEQVVGDLFERVAFLKQRIEELSTSLNDRILLNKRFVEDINSDIDEKQKMLQIISDRDEMREIKLDITLLKMEKRREMMSFWKDILEIRKELRRLQEEYRIESKISSMFGQLK